MTNLTSLLVAPATDLAAAQAEPADYVWGALAWSLAITLIFAPIAIRRFRNS